MLPAKHIATTILLCLAIVAIYLLRIRSSLLAFFAIVICILYILHGWIESARKRHAKKDASNNNQCLIGYVKKREGILSKGCIDVWHLYHLLFWIIIGLLVPHKFIFFAFVSVSWEVIEHIVFKNEKVLFGVENKCTSMICGRVEDIFINLIGYFIGSYLSR